MLLFTLQVQYQVIGEEKAVELAATSADARFGASSLLEIALQHLQVQGQLQKSARVQRAVQPASAAIGIPPEKLATIFESFQQAGEDTTARFGGTGLGLGIARALARLHGSDIRVESEAGKGSAFSFALPLPLAQVSDLLKIDRANDDLFFPKVFANPRIVSDRNWNLSV